MGFSHFLIEELKNPDLRIKRAAIRALGSCETVTAYIYYPWYMIKLNRYLYENTTYDGKCFGFTAEGSSLFSLLLGQMLLSLVTCYIYMPWAIIKINRYVYANTTCGDDAVFNFEANGKELFSLIFINTILTVITGGIYYPWFIAKIYAYYAQASSIIDKTA